MKHFFLFLFCLQIPCLFSLTDDERDAIRREDYDRQDRLRNERQEDYRRQDRLDDERQEDYDRQDRLRDQRIRDYREPYFF